LRFYFSSVSVLHLSDSTFDSSMKMRPSRLLFPFVDSVDAVDCFIPAVGDGFFVSFEAKEDIFFEELVGLLLLFVHIEYY